MSLSSTVDTRTLHKLAAELQAVARLLGDRQNSDSTLTARQATQIVSACLSAGNVLEQLVREREQAVPEPSFPPPEAVS